MAGTPSASAHAYFLDGKDPFERLTTALRTEIDEDSVGDALPHRRPPVPAPDVAASR